MKKLLFALILMFSFIVGAAHPIHTYKYVVIEHQDDAPNDIEKRLKKEFDDRGLTVLTEDSAKKLADEEQQYVLTAKYLCRQSGVCLFKIKLVNNKDEVIYEDEQMGGAGFMSNKNDRQSAIKKIFKELQKIDEKYINELNSK